VHAPRIGQPLIDALLASPELLLAEGTSLRFAATHGHVVGLELHDVAPDTLAGHLGLQDHDILLRVAGLPLTTEAELLEAATFAQAADRLTVLVHRDGTTHERYFLREQ
jgi:type II secretory pathway component PulC